MNAVKTYCSENMNALKTKFTAKNRLSGEKIFLPLPAECGEKKNSALPGCDEKNFHRSNCKSYKYSPLNSTLILNSQEISLQ